MKVADSAGMERWIEVDRLILAVPPEKLRQLLGNDDLYAASPRLFGIEHLRSVPMAALNLYLNRRILDIPRGHVNLIGSEFGSSFIDVSQFWTRYHNGNTVLNMIASDFASIQALSDAEIFELLFEDLRQFVPNLHHSDVQRWELMPNVNEPLFMNDVGIWHFRPAAATGLSNLFVAGDYCRSWVDLVSMEGAITTGLLAATELRRQSGLSSEQVKIESIGDGAHWFFTPLVLLFSPVALIAKVVTVLGEVAGKRDIHRNTRAQHRFERLAGRSSNHVGQTDQAGQASTPTVPVSSGHALN